MHELGIVFSIIREVRKTALENGCRRVSKVTMDIGEVSTVVPYYLEDCWKWAVAKEDELMRGCALEVNVMKAVTLCRDCGNEYPTVEFAKICPRCGSGNTILLRGNEVEIKQMEASGQP